MRLSDLAGHSVAIWGAGREGISAARALTTVSPSSLVAVDEDPERDVAGWQEAAGAAIPLHCGQAGFTSLAAAEVVVKSPGVPRVHPWLAALVEHGVYVTSGTALWMAEHGGHTIAITGTKGKSTTSALTYHLLRALGLDATFAGNIGTPLLGTAEAALHVVELSSQQCQSLENSPRWAAVTSLFPEHLDWHGSQKQYYQDKLHLIAGQPHGVVIDALDLELVKEVDVLELQAQIIRAGLDNSFHLEDGLGAVPNFYSGRIPLFPREKLPLLGRHNARNLCVALGLLSALGIDCVREKERIAAAVETFQGLAHRLQNIPDPAGKLTFVNDSLSTAPQSAIAALESFDDCSVTLIVGGTDRGLDYTVLRDYLTNARIAPATVLAIPDSGARIAAALSGVPGVHIEVLSDLAAAVTRARALTPSGGVVLLSPAAPSYGRFTDHAHRAAVFQRAIADSAEDVVDQG